MLGLQALIALAERAAFDVRSCLNTLQFLAKQGRKVRTADITSLNMGQKDMSKGAFGIWTQLLTSRVGVIHPAWQFGSRVFNLLNLCCSLA